ncbi:unnamed protein product [Sphenostylis stenocarpa]|uniref:Uncharacterized protein n=1 Tax=Sphenostylis stenocarpa TaxID=92480 RepID=A0AA86VXK7_9FABA|nr:unnamed protein product [Sphenostylis stenocarpa]
MNKQRVVVTGGIDPMKVLKKLKKRTGKRVEIVSKKDEEAKDESDKLVIMHQFALENDCCMKATEAMMMFSDENPNACADWDTCEVMHFVASPSNMLNLRMQTFSRASYQREEVHQISTKRNNHRTFIVRFVRHMA